MELNKEIQEGLEKASHFVVKGVKQILTRNLDETHGVSPSPGFQGTPSHICLMDRRGTTFRIIHFYWVVFAIKQVVESRDYFKRSIGK